MNRPSAGRRRTGPGANSTMSQIVREASPRRSQLRLSGDAVRKVYRPRDRTGPRDLLDFLDRHIGRATDCGHQLRLYVALILSVAAAGSMLVVTAAVMIAMLNIPWWSVTTLAVGSTGVLAYRGITGSRREDLQPLDQLTEAADGSSASLGEPVP
jgi:hypothetical protein